MSNRKERSKIGACCLFNVRKKKPTNTYTETIEENIQESIQENIQESIQKNIQESIPESFYITGCEALSNGFYVVDSLNKRLAVLNRNGEHMKDIVQFTSCPLDVCYIKSRNITAVTIPTDHMVVFVDTKERKIVESVVYRLKCYYIKCNDNNLFIGCPNNGKIIVADLFGRELGYLNIPGDRFAVTHDSIYAINEKEDLVLCYDIQGNQRWIAPDIVRDPIGIYVDKHDYVYVFSKHNTLHSISPNGFRNTIILDRSDGLDDHEYIMCMERRFDIKFFLAILSKSNNRPIAYHYSGQTIGSHF